MSNLDDIKVGDEIAVVKCDYGRTTAAIRRVSRTTKTQIMVIIPNRLDQLHEWKFWRKDGHEVGGRQISGTWWRIKPLNDETRALAAETIEAAEDDRIRRLINKARLTREQLRRIAEILEPPE